MGVHVENGHPIPADVAPAPPLIWLALPLGLAVILAVVGKLFPDFYGRYLNPEIGAIELAQFAVMFFATYVAADLFWRARNMARWFARWTGVAFACCFYVAGEEASWGQHIIGWSTPAEWGAINDQNETNFHNVSSWFDQKPRMLFEIGVLIGGLVLPVLRRLGKLNAGRLAYITPPIHCVPVASVVLIRRLDEIRIDWSSSSESLFYRGAELQELFMYLFALFYLLSLRRRLHGTPPPP